MNHTETHTHQVSSLHCRRISNSTLQHYTPLTMNILEASKLERSEMSTVEVVAARLTELLVGELASDGNPGDTNSRGNSSPGEYNLDRSAPIFKGFLLQIHITEPSLRKERGVAGLNCMTQLMLTTLLPIETKPPPSSHPPPFSSPHPLFLPYPPPPLSPTIILRNRARDVTNNDEGQGQPSQLSSRRKQASMGPELVYRSSQLLFSYH